MILHEKKKLFSEFIENYFTLLNIMKNYFNSHNDFNCFYKKNLLLKKTNIKLFIQTWYKFVTIHYKSYIEQDNIEYFLNNASNIFGHHYFNKYFNYFKNIYDNTEEKIVKEILNKVKNLTRISYIYYNN